MRFTASDPTVAAAVSGRAFGSLDDLAKVLDQIGKADLVEFAADGSAYPVEYKHGPKRQRIHDDLQLAAQALCLEEMTGKPVPRGAIFHFSSRRRREVSIDDLLRRQTILAIAGVRALLSAPNLPAPVNDARCRQCSLKELCQPQALAARTRFHELLGSLYTPP